MQDSATIGKATTCEPMLGRREQIGLALRQLIPETPDDLAILIPLVRDEGEQQQARPPMDRYVANLIASHLVRTQDQTQRYRKLQWKKPQDTCPNGIPRMNIEKSIQHFEENVNTRVCL